MVNVLGKNPLLCMYCTKVYPCISNIYLLYIHAYQTYICYTSYLAYLCSSNTHMLYSTKVHVHAYHTYIYDTSYIHHRYTYICGTLAYVCMICMHMYLMHIIHTYMIHHIYIIDIHIYVALLHPCACISYIHI